MLRKCNRRKTLSNDTVKREKSNARNTAHQAFSSLSKKMRLKDVSVCLSDSQGLAI